MSALRFISMLIWTAFFGFSFVLISQHLAGTGWLVVWFGFICGFAGVGMHKIIEDLIDCVKLARELRDE